ncbi:Dys [Drosophila busckii]|uniref:Dys n=1 Tax=Drosophila busckii TaxID=30019 RepID=A0A0M4F5X8_DROBS|nr:Dys [Drosophila busckii]
MSSKASIASSDKLSIPVTPQLMKDKSVDPKILMRQIIAQNNQKYQLQAAFNAAKNIVTFNRLKIPVMAKKEKIQVRFKSRTPSLSSALSVNSEDYNNEPSGSGALASSFDKSVLHISDWLTWEQNMIKIQSVLIDDVDAVRLAIEKQEKVLRELKMKKPQLNELVHTAEVLKGDTKRQQLQEKAVQIAQIPLDSRAKWLYESYADCF